MKNIVSILVSSVIISWSANAQVVNPQKPNIVLILVDDVGYTDIGAFSAHINNTTTDKLYYETPEIDKLARQGTMFTQFYACAVCAPSRASLMSGKMNNRMGMWDAYAAVNTTFEKSGKPVPEGLHILDNEPWNEYNYNKTDRGVSIPLGATALHDVKTIPQGLNGYHSAFIGKWHMGSHNHVGYRPEDQGFDETLAYFDGGGSSYHRNYPWNSVFTGERPFFNAHAALTHKWDKQGEDFLPRQDYLSDDITYRVRRFLEDRTNNHPDEPFFLYIAHPACHTPIESRQDDLAYFQQKANVGGLIGHKNPAYAGLVKGMDRSIGSIMNWLEILNLEKNTVVIFISDNGGHPTETRNTPLRGGKSMLYEGGVRVPMIVRWPGKTTPETICNVTSDIADIYPTVMEIADVDYSDFKADTTTDGESLAPLLEDLTNTKNGYKREDFYQFYGKEGYKGFHNFATWATLRKGDYKLHYDYQGKIELYNIAEDMFETTDLVHSNPKKALDMLVQLTDWLKANCNEEYLPKVNPNFNPNGPLPYGPYVSLEELKASLLGVVSVQEPTYEINNLANEIKLYPNPVGSLLNIETANNNSIESVRITDLKGRTIITVDGDNRTINTADLQSGLYFATVQTAKGVVTKKFEKN
ncbi:sulfatase-like hydrolase/transferase [Bacteroidota bacterium]